MSVKIYKITNNINGKIYIGQTKTSIERRFISHKSAARRGINYILYKTTSDVLQSCIHHCSDNMDILYTQM